MNIVAYEGVVVLCTKQEQRPVVIAIAAGRPRSSAAKLTIGNSNMACRASSADEHWGVASPPLVVPLAKPVAAPVTWASAPRAARPMSRAEVKSCIFS